MISYIFVVAVVNLAVGFLLAMYLGRRCRALTPAGEPCPSPDDLEEGGRQVLEQTNNLAGANHRVHDALDEAMVGILGSSKQVVPGETAPVTASPADFELAVARWWQDHLDRTRPLSVAWFDVDEFSQINEQLGPEAANEVLQALGRLLQEEQDGQCVFTCFSGPRFLFLLPDVDLHDATPVAERIRQTIEATTFDYHDHPLRLTISSAVVAAADGDTPVSLCGRADVALQEAKHYGRNQTFSHDGDYATPIAPTNLSLEATPVEV